MKGTIRVIAGLLITLGAVGGIDAGNSLIPCVALAAAGLGLMYSGTNAMKKFA